MIKGSNEQTWLYETFGPSPPLSVLLHQPPPPPPPPLRPIFPPLSPMPFPWVRQATITYHRCSFYCFQSSENWHIFSLMISPAVILRQWSKRIFRMASSIVTNPTMPFEKSISNLRCSVSPYRLAPCLNNTLSRVAKFLTVSLHLFGASNFIGPEWGAPLLFSGLRSVVLLFVLLFS